MYMYVLHVYASISNRPVFGYISIDTYTYIHIHAYTCIYIQYIHTLTYLQIRTLKKCKYIAVFLDKYIQISISLSKYIRIRTARFTDEDGDAPRALSRREEPSQACLELGVAPPPCVELGHVCNRRQARVECRCQVVHRVEDPIGGLGRGQIVKRLLWVP